MSKTEQSALERFYEIVSKLKIEKSHRESKGKYTYRNLDDIYSIVKPSLHKAGLGLKLLPEVLLIGEWYYHVVTAEIVELATASEVARSTGNTREPVECYGMSVGQLSKSTQTYATKQAIETLFQIGATDLDDVESSPYEAQADPGVPKNLVDESDIKQIKKGAAAAAIKIDKILAGFGVSDLSELTKVQYQEAMKRLLQLQIEQAKAATAEGNGKK